MKKLFLALFLVLLFVIPAQAGRYFGIFGTATEVDDTCRICFPTFDTLGHSADATGDSVYFLRFVRGTLVDSTYGGTKLRNYFYCTTKGAYDGTNLGQYTVVFYWRPVRDFWYNDDGYYVVEPETISYARGDTIQRNASTLTASDNIGINWGDVSNPTSILALTGTSISTSQVIAGVSGNVTGSVGSISGISYPTNFANLAITATTGKITVGTNDDKTGYGLADNALTRSKADTSFYARLWGDDTTRVVTYLDWMWNILVDSLLDGSGITYYWGACDGCYQRLFPVDGSANKDSIYIIDPSQDGVDTLVAKVVYHHKNTASVVDSIFYYRNPWW